MNLGKIIGQARSGKSGIFGDFHIEFPSRTFGPYNYVFTKENLYFSEELGDRGARLFPLKEQKFENTEIFIEKDSIVICCGVRGSFSGQEKLFVEFVNLESEAKYRFSPEEVSLIYHTRDTLICYYKDEDSWKKIELSLIDFSLISETQEHISAFFKVLYRHDTKDFSRLIYKDEGYFFDMVFQKTSSISYHPNDFDRNNFQLRCIQSASGEDTFIDVWEASLTGEM